MCDHLEFKCVFKQYTHKQRRVKSVAPSNKWGIAGSRAVIWMYDHLRCWFEVYHTATAHLNGFVCATNCVYMRLVNYNWINGCWIDLWGCRDRVSFWGAWGVNNVISSSNMHCGGWKMGQVNFNATHEVVCCHMKSLNWIFPNNNIVFALFYCRHSASDLTRLASLCRADRWP